MFAWLKGLTKYLKDVYNYDDNYSPVYTCPRCKKTLQGKDDENVFCTDCMIEWEVEVEDQDYYNQVRVYRLTGRSTYKPK